MTQLAGWLDGTGGQAMALADCGVLWGVVLVEVRKLHLHSYLKLMFLGQHSVLAGTKSMCKSNKANVDWRGVHICIDHGEEHVTKPLPPHGPHRHYFFRAKWGAESRIQYIWLLIPMLPFSAVNERHCSLVIKGLDSRTGNIWRTSQLYHFLAVGLWANS